MEKKWITLLFLFVVLVTVLLVKPLTLEAANVPQRKNAQGILLNKPSAAHERKKPQALRPGDCIGILAPASMGSAEYSKAIEFLHALGYRTKLASSTNATYGYFAGPDTMRAENLNAFFKDDSIQAILCLRGGYGSARILNKLDYEAIAQHPKLFIGYSDVTALHTALGQKSGIVTIHGPMVTSFKSPGYSEYTAAQFSKGLKENEIKGDLPMPKGKQLEAVIPGKAEGILVGGNLTLLASTIGTPYELDGRGSILFLEDVDENSYRIDRLMQQLWQSGLLQRVNGIVLGEFLNCEADEGDFTTEDVLRYYAKLAGVPVLKGVPSGHGADNAFLPMGVHVTLYSNEDTTARLIFNEAYAQ